MFPWQYKVNPRNLLQVYSGIVTPSTPITVYVDQRLILDFDSLNFKEFDSAQSDINEADLVNKWHIAIVFSIHRGRCTIRKLIHACLLNFLRYFPEDLRKQQIAVPPKPTSETPISKVWLGMCRNTILFYKYSLVTLI